MSIQFEQRTSEAPPLIKDDILRLEKEHLEIHKKLNKAESAFGSHPEDKDLKAKVDGLKKKLKEIEKRLEKSLSLYR